MDVGKLDLDPAPALETLISVYSHVASSAATAISVDANAAPPPPEEVQSIPSSSTPGPLQQTATTNSGKSESSSECNSPDERSIKNGKSRPSSKSVPDESDKPKKREVQPADGKKRPRKRKSDDSGSEEDEDEATEGRIRFRWTDELHQYFLACIFELGLEIASPKKVFLKMMADKQFARTILDDEMYNQMTNPESTKKFGAHHVKSHLQRFRSNIVHPREAFIKQLTELMQESKRRKKQDVKNKVLNPEYHTYPFAADRTFPDNINHSEVASVLNNAAHMLKNTLPAANQVMSAPPVPNMFNSASSSSSASAAAAAAADANRPRGLSLFEPGEQMKAQVEMQRIIENQFHRQVVQAQPVGEMLDFDNVFPNAELDDENLFNWFDEE